MSRREWKRTEGVSRVREGDLTLVEAAEQMEGSYRQGKRLWKRYREGGAKGPQHRSGGRGSNRRPRGEWSGTTGHNRTG